MLSKGVLQIGSANVVSQIISFIAVPLITRIYSPVEYGIFSVALAIIGVLVPLSALKYSSAIVLPGEQREAANVFALSLCMVFVMTLMSGLIIEGLSVLIPSLVLGRASYIYVLLILSVLAQGLAQVIALWSIRIKDFPTSALSRVVESLCDRGLVLGFGFYGTATAGVLISGRIVGSAMSAAFSSYRAWDKGHGSPLKYVNVTEVLRAARRYKSFALYSTWASLFDATSRQLPMLIMAQAFPVLIVGYYGLALQAINLPMMVVGDAIATVFVQKAAENKSDKTVLSKISLNIVSYLLYLIIAPTIILTFQGEELFAILFGERWRGAGEFAEILAMGFMVMFLHRPISALFDVLELQKQRMYFDAAIFVVRCGSALAGAYIYGSYVFVIAGITVGSIVVYGLGIFYLLGTVHVGGCRVFLVGVKAFIFFSPTTIALAVFRFTNMGLPERILIGSVAIFGQLLVRCVLRPDTVVETK